MNSQGLVIVRGGGDIATGTIYKLVRCGYEVLVLETSAPTAIRRNVAFSEAVYEGQQTVEDMTCYLAQNQTQAQEIMRNGSPAMLIDPDCQVLRELQPIAVVDAILAKKNLGMSQQMAPITIALGPGFCAGQRQNAERNAGTGKCRHVEMNVETEKRVDVDAVIETMRGHRLGRVIYDGSAIPNTGVPGAIAGVSDKRVIHSPASGILHQVHRITDTISEGEIIAWIETESDGNEEKSDGNKAETNPEDTGVVDCGRIDITATISGLLRGLIREGYPVTKGFKIADIDPRITEYDNCFTISDKARCIAGGVLEALQYLTNHRKSDQTEQLNPIEQSSKTNQINQSQQLSRHVDTAGMIYADYAATGIHKPECVIRAVTQTLECPGNPGRGAHQAALSAGRLIYQTRKKIADFFEADGPEQVVFTSGITESLNLALKGTLKQGDHVITTCMEHNSVLRPLYELEDQNKISLSVTMPEPEAILRAVRPETRVIAMTHASNVTGEVYDIRTVGHFCREHQLLFIVDTAQSAGTVPIYMREDAIDILCFTGHKGLMGPQGIGGMCVRSGVCIRPLVTGGSGVQSFSRTQPLEMPTALEAGTLNTPGIAGLGAALDWLSEIGTERIRKKEQEDLRYFYQRLREITGIRIYGNPDEVAEEADRTVRHTAVLSINIGECSAGTVSRFLEERYGILTRAGAHCAPLAHEYYSTREQGMVRFSFGYATTREELDAILRALTELAQEIFK